MKERDRALFNLVQFDRDFLRPAAVHFSEAKSRHWKAMRFCELVSAYFWLELGIEVGYFPVDESASAVGQRFVPFFGQFDEGFKDYGYMFDTSFGMIMAQALQTPFSHHRRVDSVSSIPPTLAAFGSALTIEISLARNQAGENALAVINFAPDLLQDVIVRDHALQIGTDPIFDRSSLMRGFPTVVEYMECMIRLSNSMFGDTDIAERERPALERRIRQVTRWRVNRFRVNCDDDFLRLGRFFSDSAGLDFNEVRPKLKELLDNWGFTHTKVASGSGSS